MKTKTKILICFLVTFFLGIILVKIATDLVFFNDYGIAGSVDGGVQVVFILASLMYGCFLGVIPLIFALVFRKNNWFKIYLIVLIILSIPFIISLNSVM